MPSSRPALPLGAWLGTWAFVLDRLDDQSTRLLVRLRTDWRSSPANFVWGRVFTEPTYFVMERRMLKTIKRLAERSGASKAAMVAARPG